MMIRIRNCGYNYQTLSGKPVLFTSRRQKRIEDFLRVYFDAIKKEAAGTHVMVYMDESYVHDTHCRKFGWQFNGDNDGTERVNGVDVQQSRSSNKTAAGGGGGGEGGEEIPQGDSKETARRRKREKD